MPPLGIKWKEMSRKGLFHYLFRTWGPFLQVWGIGHSLRFRQCVGSCVARSTFPKVINAKQLIYLLLQSLSKKLTKSLHKDLISLVSMHFIMYIMKFETFPDFGILTSYFLVIVRAGRKFISKRKIQKHPGRKEYKWKLETDQAREESKKKSSNERGKWRKGLFKFKESCEKGNRVICWLAKRQKQSSQRSFVRSYGIEGNPFCHHAFYFSGRLAKIACRWRDKLRSFFSE